MPERVTVASSDRHAFEVSLVDDAVSAQINLGYKPAEAKRAVDSVGGYVENQTPKAMRVYPRSAA
jgi:Holliday junction resolvasome RuvABC DNA-binding subunit